MIPELRHTVLTFTEVPGTQEVNTNHEEDYNCYVDGQVVGLVAHDQPLSVRNRLVTHIGIPVGDQNRSSSDFTRYTNSGSLRGTIRISRYLIKWRDKERTYVEVVLII